MTRFRNWTYLCGVVALLTGLTLSAGAQPIVCNTSVSVTPILRGEGLSEPVGDVVLYCTGGTPTLHGQLVPQVDITLFLNTNITSKVLGQTLPFNEALLIVDEPNSPNSPGVQCGPSGTWNGSTPGQICTGSLPGPPVNLSTSGQPYPILNCGAVVAGLPAAPDGGLSGPGVCGPIAPAGPDPSGNAPEHTYDGTIAGGSYWTPPIGQSAYTDPCTLPSFKGTVGAPGYGCGRPNVFQGRVGTPSSPNQYNAVSFLGVPFDAPGNEIGRTIRITNIRANANAIGVSSIFLTTQVLANIAITGPVSVTLSNPQQIVGYINQGLFSSASPCGTPAANTARVCEGFASSWKTKNVSFTVGDNNGVPGNATYNLSPCVSSYCRNGNVSYPADDAQNIPGVIYNSESGFQWQNNTPNGPPSPNPPVGFGFGGSVPNTGNPLSDDWVLTAFATGMAGAGVANAGTRIAVNFSNVPGGAFVQVPTEVNILRWGTSTVTGIMVLINTDASGAGPYSVAGTGTLGPSNMAVYEVLYADPYSTEYADVPYTVTTGSPAGVQAAATFAPFYTSVASTQPSPNSTYPAPTLAVPRFAPAVYNCGSCSTLTPAQGVNTGPVSVQIGGLIGAALTPSSVVTLTAPSLPTITGTATGPTWTFDLTGATPGVRNLALGGIVVDPNSFTVLGAPQTISFAAIASRPVGSPAFTVSATASSTLPVSFASLTPLICSVSPTTGTTTVTLVASAIGTCTIQATQGGSIVYAAATPVNQSFQVTSLPQLVITKSLSRVGGVPGTISVVVTVTNNGGTAANNVKLTGAKINSTNTTTSLPATVGTGTIAGGGGFAQITVSIPGTVGTTGTVAMLTLGGTYTGGSFLSTGHITLP